jgi:hypothetical protein
MRDIIYRGKTKDGEWEYGGVVIYEKDAFIITKEDCSWSIMGDRGDYDGCITPVLPETVGQFVGLTDKNGKKIFEGDIVNIEYLETTVKNAVIEYVGASFYGTTEFDAWELNDYTSLEVIGNIHDNKELLEVK